MTFRIEMYDHAWGGWRTGNHESASPGHPTAAVANALADTEVHNWPYKRLRVVDEETGEVIQEHKGKRARS